MLRGRYWTLRHVVTPTRILQSTYIPSNALRPLVYICEIIATSMWRSVATFFLLTAIVLQSMHRVVIVGGYYASAYAKNCENKSKPQMKCGGRCQMMKKLETEKKNDKAFPSSRFSDEFISSRSFFAKVFPPGSANLIHHERYNNAAPAGFYSNHFHPPGMRLIEFT